MDVRTLMRRAALHYSSREAIVHNAAPRVLQIALLRRPKARYVNEDDERRTRR